MPRVGLVFYLLVFTLLTRPPAATADPVETFIVRADSIAKGGPDRALAAFVQQHSVLVGAAVGQLIDVAIELGDQGDLANETENIAFAIRIATLHEAHGGSDEPHKLALTYKNWSPAERKDRVRARGLETQAVEARKANDFDQAVKLFDQARAIYGTLGDNRSIAVNWGSLGVVAWYAGDNEALGDYYGKALRARREIDDRILEGKTLNGIGTANYGAGAYEDAITWYRRAADLRAKTGDLNGLATSLTYMSDAQTRLGRYVDARTTLENLIPVLEETGAARQLVDAITLQANVHAAMGRLSDADSAYVRAIDIADQAELPIQKAFSHYNLAINHRMTSRYRDALAELDRASVSLDQAEEDELSLRAKLLLERGLTYMSIGELDKSRDDLIAFRERVKDWEDPAHYVDGLISLADLYETYGAYDRGLTVAEEAIKRSEEAGLPRKYRNAHRIAAQLEQRADRPEKALPHWQEALAQDENDGAHGDAAEDRIGIATAQAMLGDLAKARQTFHAVRQELPKLERREYASATYFGIGHTYEESDPDSAAHYYEKALDVIERSRATVGAAEVRTGFLSGERRFQFEEVARYYAQLHNRAPNDGWASRAFHVAERAKARSLMDLLEYTMRTRGSDAENAILDSLYSVDESVAGGTKRKQAFQKQFTALRDENVKRSFGDLATHAVSGLEDVQNTIPKNTVLLEYALGDTQSLLWVANRKGHEVYTLPGRDAIGPQVERLRDALQKPGSGDAVLRTTARHLYTILVEPAAPFLKKAEKLLIVPDGVLFEMPFEVLLTEEPNDETAWGKQAFLARSYATVYAPSASIFFRLRDVKRDQKYERELLALGDPDFGEQAGITRGDALARLPHTRTEVTNISAGLKDRDKRVLLGKDATEANLKLELAAGPPRILHLATHGLVDAIEPTNSSVALCPDPESGEDGYLHTLEIIAAPMDVGLVVVSACESAVGKVGRGEGVVGLSRAFIASGAGGIVASLWKVSDESTAQLMSKFYERMLGKKKPASEALNDARLALLKTSQYSHPFYWSPFIMIGTERSPW